MTAEPRVVYEFGPFRLDPDKQVLLRDDEPVPPTPKNIETLLERGEEAAKRFLAERAQVVAKQPMPRPGTTHLLHAEPRVRRRA